MSNSNIIATNSLLPKVLLTLPFFTHGFSFILKLFDLFLQFSLIDMPFILKDNNK